MVLGRWIQANELTNFTAIYPAQFGEAIGVSETMKRMSLDLGTPQEVKNQAEIWARVILHRLPSLEERKRLAQEAIEFFFNLAQTVCLGLGLYFLGSERLLTMTIENSTK